MVAPSRKRVPAFAPARRRHASCVRGGGEMKPIRRLLDLMARRRLRRTAARRIREMLAAADSGRRLGSFRCKEVETMESLLRVSDDRSEAQLQPDILLPCQLGDGLFGGARLQPEKR